MEEATPQRLPDPEIFPQKNVHLRYQAEIVLPQKFKYLPEGISIDISRVVELFENVYDSPLCCSLLSYWLRAESTIHLDEANDIREQAIQKELKAALFFQSVKPHIDYKVLFRSENIWTYDGDSTRSRHPQSMMHFRWNQAVRRYRSTHSQFNAPIILPYHNGRKDLGYETQERFFRLSVVPEEIFLRKKTMTSLDLLKWHHLSGERIYGPLEVRIKWEMNHIPPCDDIFLFEDDWISVLCARRRGEYMSTPVVIQGEIPLDIHTVEGTRQRATSSPVVHLMEVLGYIETSVAKIQVEFLEVYADRLRGYILGTEISARESLMLDVVFLRNPPPWLYDLLVDSLPVNPYEEPLEKLTGIKIGYVVLNINCFMCPWLMLPR